MKLSKYVLSPFRALIQALRERGVMLSRNDWNIKRYKNKHVGETCFILGSGPSLTMSDLDLIEKRQSIGVNKIYLAYANTVWRPTYYVVADRRIADEVKLNVHEIQCPRFIEKWAYPPVKEQGNWIVLPELHEYGVRTNKFSRNLLCGTGGGATVIYAALQIAYYLGFQRVVLLGVDFSYGNLKPTGEISPSGEALVTADAAAYFNSNYSQPGRVLSAPRYDEQREAFRNAYHAFRDDGRILVNASRRTELDVIPRARLEDYLS
jgi:hypothetical protein